MYLQDFSLIKGKVTGDLLCESSFFFNKKSLSKNERKVKARTSRVIKKINLFIPTF